MRCADQASAVSYRSEGSSSLCGALDNSNVRSYTARHGRSPRRDAGDVTRACLKRSSKQPVAADLVHLVRSEPDHRVRPRRRSSPAAF
jgi:hypothetical protein